MGFSWSSAVAQSVMIDICRRSGLRDEQLLCLEEPPPVDMAEVATVATDDVILFHKTGFNSRYGFLQEKRLPGDRFQGKELSFVLSTGQGRGGLINDGGASGCWRHDVEHYD